MYLSHLTKEGFFFVLFLLLFMFFSRWWELQRSKTVQHAEYITMICLTPISAALMQSLEALNENAP